MDRMLQNSTYPKIQIFTVADYFDGKRPDLHALCGPRHTSDTLMPKGSPRQKAKRIEKSGKTKPELGIRLNSEEKVTFKNTKANSFAKKKQNNRKGEI